MRRIARSLSSCASLLALAWGPMSQKSFKLAYLEDLDLQVAVPEHGRHCHRDRGRHSSGRDLTETSLSLGPVQ